MIKRHKELKRVQGVAEKAVIERGYIPKSGGHVGKSYGTMTIKCYVKLGSTKMVLSCSSCGKDYYTSKTEDNKTPSLTDCQCHNEGIDKSVRVAFHNKKLTKEDKEYWCTGCESYREVHKRSDRYCDVCHYISTNKITVYETFEEIMGRWDSTTHKPCTMKLPYLSGTSTKGFKVRGFTYISVEDYEWCSRLMWFKNKSYIRASCSKDNCKRVEENIKGVYGKYILLHRWVLNLSNECDLVGDHVSGFTLDNRGCNLRACTHTENTHNSRKNTIGASKYKGVGRLNIIDGKSWICRLYLGCGKYKAECFHTEEEAALAYNRFLDQYRPSKFNIYNVVK